MKFSIHRTLFSSFLNRLGGAVLKSNAPADPGRYITLKTEKGKLSGTVAREDSMANVTLDQALINDKDILDIESDGSCAVIGMDLISLVCNTGVDGIVRVEYDKSVKLDVEESEEDEDDEDEGPKPPQLQGALMINQDGLTGKLELYRLVGNKLPDYKAIGVNGSASVAVSGAEFIKAIEKLGLAAGKATQNVGYGHMLFTSSNGQLDMVTMNGYQLCWARVVVTGSDLKALAPYDLTLADAKTFDPDYDVRISKPDDGPQGVLLSQDVCRNGNAVGLSNYRLFATSSKFADFQSILKNADFKYSCKVKKHYLEHVAKVLSVFDQVKTSVCFDPKKELITFSKTESRGAIEGLEVPITDCKGDKLELFLSSRFIKEAVSQADDEIEIKFSGKRTIAMMGLAQNVKLFLQPFSSAAQ